MALLLALTVTSLSELSAWVEGEQWCGQSLWQQMMIKVRMVSGWSHHLPLHPLMA